MRSCSLGRGASSLVVAAAFAACSPPPLTPLPEVGSFGGPVLAHPRVVTITFANDVDRAEVEAHAQWMVQSNWLATVGEEYGITRGEVLAAVRRAESAPSSIDSRGVESFLQTGLADGSIPQPADAAVSNVIYIVNYPRGTTVTLSGDATASSCRSFYGYHAALRRNGIEFAYAVVPSCSESFPGLSAREERELAVSHEFIEAVTDPFPATRPAIRMRGLDDPWIAFGGELADLCETGPNGNPWHEDVRVAQRVWSNRAAAAHAGNPCVPVPAGENYFNVSITPAHTQRAAPGSTLHFTLRGWATPHSTPWSLQTLATGEFMPTLQLGAQSLWVDETTSLEVRIPADAPVGAVSRIAVVSYHTASEYFVAPMLVIVGEPCNTHADCASCTAATGCGWCATSGRCEATGSNGSAESACTGNDFSDLSGACPGFCEAHGASCTECASQGGCGWCETPSGGRCLPASWNYATSADATCSGASWSFVPSYCGAP